MSFDLAVWSHIPRTVKDAEKIYYRLCEGDTSLLQPHPTSGRSVCGFLAELTARYPTCEAYSDDLIDKCLWSSPFNESNAHVLMFMPFSRAGEVIPFVAFLAEKYGLILYNPQNGLVRLPATVRERARRAQR